MSSPSVWGLGIARGRGMRYVQQFTDEDAIRYEVLISDCETTSERHYHAIPFQTLTSGRHCTERGERGETHVSACSRVSLRGGEERLREEGGMHFLLLCSPRRRGRRQRPRDKVQGNDWRGE